MATYLPGKPFKITRHEGDTADIVFTVTSSINLAGMDVLFQVRNAYNDLVFSKSSAAGGGMVVDGQVVRVSLLPVDTTGFPGTHKWELQVSSSIRVQTLVNGPFIINKEVAI
jgi:hypothetical protein